MEITLKNSIMLDLSQDYCELLEIGYSNEQAYDSIKEKTRNEYDGEIWELVDSEENTLDFNFDDCLYEIMEDIQSRGNYYYDNIQAGN
jgi:hypothetical protein